MRVSAGVADQQDHPGRTPWLAPAAILDRVAEMRADGARKAADALLDAIGAGRTPQEVAGIVSALTDAARPGTAAVEGGQADAERVLAAAARRAPAELAEL